MDPIAVDIRLMRAVLGPELKVVQGRALMARVVDVNASGRGSLSIAGALVEAKLPSGVQAGQELRLIVRHVSPERVVLGLSDPNALPPPAAPPVALPGGGSVRVDPDAGTHRGGRGPANGDRHSLTLRYEAPSLGPVDLRFELDAQSLRLSATFAAGPSVDRARAAAGLLRDALSQAVGRPVTVDIDARREPLDLYA